MPPVGVTAATLNRMRASALKLMPETCTIQQNQRVDDGSGGKKRSWVTVATNVPCRLDKAGGSGDPSQGANANTGLYPFTAKYDAPLTDDCRVLHGGHTYEIAALFDDQTPLITKDAELRRVDPAP